MIEKKRHIVQMSELHDKEEVMAWCWAYIGRRNEVWDCYSNYYEREFSFNEEKDAVLFSLKWS